MTCVPGFQNDAFFLSNVHISSDHSNVDYLLTSTIPSNEAKERVWSFIANGTFSKHRFSLTFDYFDAFKDCSLYRFIFQKSFTGTLIVGNELLSAQKYMTYFYQSPYTMTFNVCIPKKYELGDFYFSVLIKDSASGCGPFTLSYGNGSSGPSGCNYVYDGTTATLTNYINGTTIFSFSGIDSGNYFNIVNISTTVTTQVTYAGNQAGYTAANVTCNGNITLLYNSNYILNWTLYIPETSFASTSSNNYTFFNADGNTVIINVLSYTYESGQGEESPYTLLISYEPLQVSTYLYVYIAGASTTNPYTVAIGNTSSTNTGTLGVFLACSDVTCSQFYPVNYEQSLYTTFPPCPIPPS